MAYLGHKLLSKTFIIDDLSLVYHTLLKYKKVILGINSPVNNTSSLKFNSVVTLQGKIKYTLQYISANERK